MDHVSATARIEESGFCSAHRWIQSYEQELQSSGTATEDLRIVISDPVGHCKAVTCRISSDPVSDESAATFRRVERTVKTLLWLHGGCEIWLQDRADLLKLLQHCYGSQGSRAFDVRFLAGQVYHQPLRFHLGAPSMPPQKPCFPTGVREKLEGCRIGYDLGGSDRKCAALIDGKVVYSEEIPWDPYHQPNPEYHISGVQDCLRRAAAHLPRVDAIGGSSAGVMIDHVPQVASLFRGLSEHQMETELRPFFRNLSDEWGGIPVTLLNDGDIAALAGAQWLGVNGVLGIAMGTSLAAGYVDPQGQVGGQLNELAFCPVDWRTDAAVDEWSGDVGCGVQYFSQQAVLRLARELGIGLPAGVDAAEGLRTVQDLASKGDMAALHIFEQIGTYLGETLVYWRQYYTFEHLVLMGRVVSGAAGACIVRRAQQVLDEILDPADPPLTIHVPDETFRRHGQAIVAASVPYLKTSN